MPESYYQIPVDSTGKKIRTRERVEGVNTVHDQSVFLSGEPAWSIMTPAVVFAQNKHFLTIFNQAGSNQVLKLRALFMVNMQITAVTGVPVQFDVRRISAVTGGTAVTPVIHDSADAALTAFTCVHTPTTVTEVSTMFSFLTTNEEAGIVSGTTGGPASLNWQMQQTNLIPISPELKEFEMNPGEGYTVKNVTASTVGSFGVYAVVTRSI